MGQLEWNNRFFITGTARVGKSWFRDWIIQQYIELDKRRYFIVIDDRFDNVQTLEKLGFRIEEIDRSRAVKAIDYAAYLRKVEKVAFVTTDITQDEIRYFLDRVCRAAWELTDALIAIDEAWQYLPRGREPEEVRRLVRGGAKSGIDMMIVTHRVVDIHPELISLCNVFISFRVDELNSVDRIQRYFDQFQDGGEELIDQSLPGSMRREAAELVRHRDVGRIIKKLPNRYFLYADRVEGLQELSCTNIL